MRSLRNASGLLRGSRGSVAVEFALFLPLLLTLVFGVVELGQAWYQQQMLANASREGARVGALYDQGGQDDQFVVTHVQNLLTQSGYPGQVQVQSTGAAGTAGDLVTVQVTSPYEFPVLGALVPMVGSINLSATTVMRHE